MRDSDLHPAAGDHPAADLTPAEQLVDATLAAQRAKGRRTYGQGLDAHDGHDWPMEALQEALDGMQYLAAEVVRLRAEVASLSRPVPDGLARDLADLRALSDGWLDGTGEAPDAETLDWLEQTLPRWVAGGMPVPRLYPTEDGLVCAEWPVGPDGVDASADFHACVVRAPGGKS